jgi:hypothetical protein
MKRHLLNVLTALSLLLCMAVVGIWTLAGSWSFTFGLCRGGYVLYARSFTDRLAVGVARDDYPALYYFHAKRWPSRGGGGAGGFLYYRHPFARAVMGPYWFVALCFAALPTHRVWRKFHPVARAAGLCPSCGYDLRATPGRCPECGTVAAVNTSG